MIHTVRLKALLSLVLLGSLLPLSAFADTTLYDFEAEKGDIQSPMIRERIGGYNAVITEEKNEGSVEFAFSLEDDGTYRFEAKTLAPSRSEDSFEISIDGEDKEIWDVPTSEKWHWSEVATRDNDSGLYELSEGEHTITFYGREKTALDRIRVIKVGDVDVARDEDNDDEDEEELEALEVDDTPSSDSDDSPRVQNNGAVLYVSPKGNDSSSGSESKPLETLQRALEKAKPGTTIKLQSGTYSEEIETVVDGTKDEPIIIEAAEDAKPVFDLGFDTNAPRFVNSNYIFRDIEVKNFNEGIRLEGAENVIIENIKLHHGKNECLRVRYFSRNNIIRNNEIYFCGAKNSSERMMKGNGEAIYIGTAPEQREKNGGKPDTSTGNRIENNVIHHSTEAIDIKEDSSNTIIKDNRVYENSDPDSGAINIRADKAIVTGNVSENNGGAGYRFGGDEGVSSPKDSDYHYGQDSKLRDNVSKNNDGNGYKFMWGPQDADCSNKASSNSQDAYYFGSGVKEFMSCGS